MNYKKINNLTGWAVFAIATIVYLLTMEPNGSLWDCGEFAGSAINMGVPHPPGAPLFIIIGRIFGLFGEAIGIGAGGGVALASVFSSSFTILFLFWTITHFAKKIKMKQAGVYGLAGDAMEALNIQAATPSFTKSATFDIMAAGVVGALAYTFSDSFWYSAVESEVYAMSSLCTAVVFWAALKWEDHPENTMEGSVDGRNRADRWMILIFFIMGMSIGVHLLNILTIPPIILIYYFKRYKKTTNGILIALFISILILGFVQKAVGQWSIGMAFPFERLFVNSFGLPVMSGFVFFFILVGIAFFFAIRYANKSNMGTLRLGLWCLAFTLIGMSTYMTTMIRSAANPGIDMYNVDNPYALKGYLSREQYGDFPLVYGQTYEAEVARDENGQAISNKVDDKYVLRKDDDGNLKYIKVGESRDYEYVSNDKMLLPRIWYGNEENRKNFYKRWLSPKSEVLNRLDNTVEDTYDNENDARRAAYEKNTLAKREIYRVRDHLTQKHNLNWLFTYQINWMYFRYFMWNFAGKQNDIQGFSSKRDGNWISGISFLDNMRLGDQSALPEALKNNKANNKLYFLPLILGLIGLFFHFTKHRDDWMVNMLLFLMTGLAIVGYLNQYGLQPRERDYAYVGSFYAFAVWIGLGVLQVRDWFGKFAKGLVPSIAAATLCTVAVPVLMASQEWDDHDRGKKTTAIDLAKDYLNSCPKNAILFTIGDNDTYPLWYAQEVQKVRPDIRVVNTSLLGIDWYLDQLQYKVNESAPFKLVWNSRDYEGQNLDYAYYIGQKEGGTAGMADTYPIDSFLTITKKISSIGEAFYPSKKYFVNVDIAKASKIFNLSAGDSLASRIDMQIGEGKQALTKGDFGILNIIAANINDRPICFTDDNGADLGPLGIQPYLRREGMIYRVIPSTNFKKVETNESVKTMLDTKLFGFGNAKQKGVYYDEENRRHLESIRSTYITYATELVNEGRIDDAKKLLKLIHTEMPAYSLPYASPSRMETINNASIAMVQAAYGAKEDALGKEIYEAVSKDVEQQLMYYYALSNPSGKVTKENAQKLVAQFDEMNVIETKGRREGLSPQENATYEKLQNDLFKGKLNGFTIDDFYACMRNVKGLEQIKNMYIAPKAPEPTVPVKDGVKIDTPAKPAR